MTRYSSALVSTSDTCAIGCRFCFRADRGSTVLTIPTFCRTLSRLHEVGVRSVCLTGGEPTDHPQFEQLPRLARQFGVGCSIVTAAREGRRLDALRGVRSLLDVVTLSVDSHGAMVVGATDRSIESAVEALEALRPTPVVLHMTMWRVTQEEAATAREIAHRQRLPMEFTPLIMGAPLLRQLHLSREAYVTQVRDDLNVLKTHFRVTRALTAVVDSICRGAALVRSCRSNRFYVSPQGWIRRCPYGTDDISVYAPRTEIAEHIRSMRRRTSAAVDCIPICRPL